MGCGCKITGATELETLINENKWLAGWALSMIRAMRMMYNVIMQCRNVHVYGSVGGDSTMYQTKLDTISVMLDGPVTEMRRKFDLDTVEKPDGELPAHISIEKAMEEMIKQAEGKEPIPVDEKRRAWFDKYGEDFPNKEVKEALEKDVLSMCETINRMQTVLKRVYAGAEEHNKPHLSFNITVVDNRGRPVSIPDVCDVDAVVNQFNNKLLEEATKRLESQGSPEGGADAVQDQPSD